MRMTVKYAQSTVPVVILGLAGDLDASNYLDIIAKAQELRKAGTRHILLDMSQVPFMSSSGLLALHKTALLLKGEGLTAMGSGWEVYSAMDRDRRTGIQQHLKLLTPQPKVRRTLEITGMDQFYEIYSDLPAALESYIPG